MAKRPKKHEPTKRQVDKYGRVVQLAAVVALVLMVAIDQLTPNTKIDAWLYGGMFGVAIGAKPEDVINFFRRR